MEIHGDVFRHTISLLISIENRHIISVCSHVYFHTVLYTFRYSGALCTDCVTVPSSPGDFTFRDRINGVQGGDEKHQSLGRG